MENQPKGLPPTDEKEIDLGVLFAIFIKIAGKITAAFRDLFRLVLRSLVAFLIFIRRRIVFLVAAIILGLLPGLYNYFTKGTKYLSSMTVKANFESAHDLYNKIDYFNALLKVGNTKKLASIFQIPESEAGKIIMFDIAPVDDEIQVAELYKKYFYSADDNDNRIMSGNLILRDTTWPKLIKFTEFKNKLTSYDFPLQEIHLYSFSPVVPAAVGAGLVASVASNESLSRKKLVDDSINLEQTQIILHTLSDADTLMKSFNNKVTSGKTEGASISLSPKLPQSPEIEWFDKKTELRNYLSTTRRRMDSHHNILEVYSDFNETGMPLSPFKQSFLEYSLWCLLGMFVLLLIVEVYAKINTLEKKKLNA